MNSGDREIDAMITSMEREITALKTSHQRPLGSLDFFTKTEDLNITLDSQYGTYTKTFWVDVAIQTPEVTPPIVQIGWDIPTGFNFVDLFEYNINANYNVWSYKLWLQSATIGSTTLKVTATSSLPISSITWRGA